MNRSDYENATVSIVGTPRAVADCFFENIDRWLSTDEVASLTGVTSNSVSISIIKLKDNGFVFRSIKPKDRKERQMYKLEGVKGMLMCDKLWAIALCRPQTINYFENKVRKNVRAQK